MNVVTAMGDERLNILLRKEESINVIGFDIQYQEGIFEFLEINKNIDFLILNIYLTGELNYEDLILNINEKNKNIKLIIFLEKENIKIKNYLIKNNIKYIFNKDDFNYEKIINILKNKKINLNNKKIYLNLNIKNKIKNIFKNNNKKITENILLIKNKIINKLFIKKTINKIKLIFNLKNKNKINIILAIKIKDKKNKINKKIKIIKCEDKIINKNNLEREILKIIKEEF